MNNPHEQPGDLADIFHLEIKEKSDRLMNYFLAGYFLLGIIFAFFYETWLIAFGVGGLSLLAFYSAKILLPGSSLYQYVLSVVLGVFMAQFIYQMHGLFEMHFFAFIGSAVLIIYQKWKLQIPILILVFVHHAFFSYLQNSGFHNVYFTQLDYFDLQTFIIHIFLTAVIFFICGLWAYRLKRFNEIFIVQTIQMAELQKDAQLSNERKQHADELRKLNTTLVLQAKELAFSNSELQQFAYVASHDLQEPLRTITSFLNLLEKKYNDHIDDKGKQYIQFAVDGAHRMRQIIIDLLEFSRAGNAEDKREEVNVQQLVKEIRQSFQKQLQEQGAQILYDNLPVMQTVKGPIRQVFQNLIANGLKYQKPGNMPVITLTCKEEEKQWVFSVKDNGIGIKKVDFDTIFIIFRRLHSKEEYAGTGMGLCITKKVVEYLGGEIWVESEEGTGSIFNFTVPRT